MKPFYTRSGGPGVEVRPSKSGPKLRADSIYYTIVAIIFLDNESRPYRRFDFSCVSRNGPDRGISSICHQDNSLFKIYVIIDRTNVTKKGLEIVIKISSIMPVHLFSISINFWMLKQKCKHRFCSALFMASYNDFW